MVVGKAVNGWIDEIETARLGDADERARLVTDARRTAEGEGILCPMGWVTDAWGRGGGDYSTARSAFWRQIRGVLSAVDPASSGDPAWSSRLAWSNLAKIAPAAGGNPGGVLLEVQRNLGPDLLRHEVDELRPRRVLVLTGRSWFEPFAVRLGLDVQWRTGLVEGVVSGGEIRWVIAKHPQGKPRSILGEVLEAFGAR